MMHNLNKDLVRFAAEGDLEQFQSAAEHGAWGDYQDEVRVTEEERCPPSPVLVALQEGNTALICAVKACTDLSELTEELNNLGLPLEEDPNDPLSCKKRTELKLGKKAKLAVQGSIMEVMERIRNEYRIVNLCCLLAMCDPEAENNVRLSQCC